MIGFRYFGAPARLLALFLALAGLPLAALGWLGWRLLEQDRALETQRTRERLETAAGLLTREIERGLAGWEALLPAASTAPPDAVLLVFDSRGVIRQHGVRLPYYPLVPSGPEVRAGIFAAPEAQEFREGGLIQAAASYRALASAGDRHVRAGALMRLARCLRKQQQFRQALAVYNELEMLGDTPVAGTPSELVARHERLALLEMTGDAEGAKRETASLAAALQEARFRIDRATFELYGEAAQPPASPALRLAEAVEIFWPLWQQQPTGRAASIAGGQAFVAVWRRTPTGTAAIVGGVGALMTPVESVMRNLQVRLALEDPDGRPAWGALPAAGDRVAKAYRETGLPWRICVAVSDPAAAREVWSSRRNLLSAGFGLMALVIAAASYFVFRAVQRELSVARLQSDFVAAVSHEFRTPLTAMRHLTEMLEEGGTPAERLPHYYRALGKEARRLHGLVESLLDFGRMEAGRRAYRMEDTSATDLVRQVVDEFRDRANSDANRFELHAPPDRLVVHADAEAIALALRNLLHNAVKYSPESSPVSVSVERREGLTGISVEDRGPGIPKEEQREVFRKFVRGTAARALNVKGSGIGLAMADHIVQAHGGRLELASEPGRGSRFTILLPAQPDHV